jgi:hypothetical protein
MALVQGFADAFSKLWSYLVLKITNELKGNFKASKILLVIAS